MSLNLLQPVFALVLWSLIVLFWMAVRRLPALAKAKLPREATVGGRGQDLDRILPREINWPAHNYAHLMEQPTIFYPVMAGLVMMGQGTTINVALAWTYVGLRVVHSLWQISVNTIPVRASIFLISTFVLLGLAVNGAIAAFSLA